MDINYLQQSDNALFPSKEIINAWALRMDKLSEKIESRKLLYALRPLNTNEREEELNRERGTGNTRGRNQRKKISRR